jgi:hypothetical protein
MSMLGKLFGKKKKTLKPSPDLKVCIINEESHDLYEVFGITDERRRELNQISSKAYHDFDDASKSYEDIVKHCNHVNEVIVCTIVFERIKDNRSNPARMLAELFGGR